ncbi:protein of unknown function [Thauera humireducens]|nr:protein of unknown function [Thauera humireducens]
MRSRFYQTARSRSLPEDVPGLSLSVQVRYIRQLQPPTISYANLLMLNCFLFTTLTINLALLSVTY